MFIDQELKYDPFNPNAVLGWVVICCHTWNLVGVYKEEDEARRLSYQLGSSYEVFFGSYLIDSSIFIVWGAE
ncbi:hypothetical protein ACW3ST_003414 [Salmonella enterica subsp. salamae serovar 42:b:e,n,x,z15]|nr:hypothetical protein [Salmonella enterica subsp. enterica serovar Enteritidis]